MFSNLRSRFSCQDSTLISLSCRNSIKKYIIFFPFWLLFIFVSGIFIKRHRYKLKLASIKSKGNGTTVWFQKSHMAQSPPCTLSFSEMTWFFMDVLYYCYSLSFGILVLPWGSLFLFSIVIVIRGFQLPWHWLSFILKLRHSAASDLVFFVT